MNKKAESIWELCGEDGWGPVLISLQIGEQPSHEKLAAALRGPYEMPPKVRMYLADFFAGKIKKRRGRPASVRERVNRFLKRDLHVFIEFQKVIEEKRKLEKFKRAGTPSEEAFEEVADNLTRQGIHMSPDQVRAIVYHPKYGIARRGRRRRRSR